ncbi:RadC family protein [Prosthecobacter sp.]|uniref:RadC family protein n=1 Tax=Prosthecobacter sp. TaxID=1965333 RepID=UPI003785223A
MSRIHDIPENDRPRERLLRLGPQALSDAELLALFINTGTKGENALQIGQRILRDYKSLRDLSRLEPAILRKIKALGPAKTALLAAAFELGRRSAQEPSHAEVILDRPQRIYDYIGAEMQALGHESVRIILVNTKFAVIRSEEVFRGSLNQCVAEPRDLLRKVIIHNAFGYILVHNHPSGDPASSEADRSLTRRLRDASSAIGSPLLDHVIIGTPSPSREQPYFSFKEHGML